MFTPNKTTERYDRNIFNGNGRPVKIQTKQPTKLLFYFAVDTVVGIVDGIVDALWYYEYQRGDYWPVEIIHDGKSYCGWIKDVDFLAK